MKIALETVVILAQNLTKKNSTIEVSGGRTRKNNVNWKSDDLFRLLIGLIKRSGCLRAIREREREGDLLKSKIGVTV